MQKTMSQTDSVNLTCLSKLMQNYQAERPVSAAGALAATTDADGNIVVFTVSTGGKIVCLRPSQSGGAGWSQTATGLQGSQIGVGLTESGTLLVVTPDAEVITFVEQTASGWSGPKNFLLPTKNINGNDPVSVGRKTWEESYTLPSFNKAMSQWCSLAGPTSAPSAPGMMPARRWQLLFQYLISMHSRCEPVWTRRATLASFRSPHL